MVYILSNRDLEIIVPQSAAEKPPFGLAIRPIPEILAVNEPSTKQSFAARRRCAAQGYC
jgi:hypothetical protein